MRTKNLPVFGKRKQGPTSRWFAETEVRSCRGRCQVLMSEISSPELAGGVVVLRPSSVVTGIRGRCSDVPRLCTPYHPQYRCQIDGRKRAVGAGFIPARGGARSCKRADVKSAPTVSFLIMQFLSEIKHFPPYCPLKSNDLFLNITPHYGQKSLNYGVDCQCLLTEYHGHAMLIR